MKPSVYLIVNFNWPRPFEEAHGRNARALHDAVAEADWIEETVAASGGIGPGPSSLWIFRLPNYAAIDRLLAGDDPISKAYLTFFRDMVDVHDVLREEVLFL